MTAKEYAKKYDGYPTFEKIAIDAFKAGVENSKPIDVIKLQNELSEVKKELRDLINTLQDPDKCGEFISGL